jgi:hypothetical protein
MEAYLSMSMGYKLNYYPVFRMERSFFFFFFLFSDIFFSHYIAQLWQQKDTIFLEITGDQ